MSTAEWWPDYDDECSECGKYTHLGEQGVCFDCFDPEADYGDEVEQ